MSGEVVPFGKYKGQPLEAMATDQGYLDWLMGQSWFRDKYQNIYTLIVNNFTEPSETPEHNRLQVLFLDDEFCHKVITAGHPGAVDRAYRYIESRSEDYGVVGLSNIRVQFEVGGADVVVDIVWSFNQGKWMVAYADNNGDKYASFVIEIKPTVGDDYPAIIRQMRAIRHNGYYILFIGEYCGAGATEQQFVETMKRSGIQVVFRRDVI